MPMSVKVYQDIREDGEGLWTVVWGDQWQFKQVASSQEEAFLMSEKVAFALQVRETVGKMAEAMDSSPTLVQMWFDLLFGSSNPISDADIAETGMTAEELVNGITLMQNFDRFCNNDAALVTGEYRVTINRIRPL